MESESVSKSAPKLLCSTRRAKPRVPERKFDPVPMPYSQLLPHFLNSSLVQLREVMPPQTPLPLGYEVNVICEFYSGAPEHTVENFKALKYKVQELIDSKAITFTPNRLNILNNPMPRHAGTTIIP